MRNNIDYAGCFAEARAGYVGGMPKGARGPMQMPSEDRPRERLANRGPQALSNAELLAVVLNTGTKGKNVGELARELAALLERGLEIPSAREMALMTGMGRAKAAAVAAMLEFGRRRWGAAGCKVRGPSDAFALVRHHADKRQERFVAVSLNGACEALAVRVVTVGLVDRTIVHPREVFADMLQDRASSFIVAHNHPTGRLAPSGDDDDVTLRLAKASHCLGLRFLDHLVFSHGDFYSYRRAGKLGVPADEPYCSDGIEDGLRSLLERL